MAKIQCPHCKAINENVSLDEPCRKCGTVLGAPMSSLDTGVGAPTSEMNGADQVEAPTSELAAPEGGGEAKYE